MNRFKHLFWIAGLTVGFLFFSDSLNGQDDGSKRRPNILFIIVDDQSPFDLKVYDSDSKLDTPNIDRLAREGMTFDAAYHMGSFSGAVCTPSRHMVMTGRTLWHLPIGAGKKNCPPDYHKFSLPAVFNDAGYDTMRTCKKGNSYQAANKEFQVVRDATKRGGTAETGSAWHGKQVLDYLNEREANQDTDPFLIYFGFSHPHDVRDGTPELLEKYGAVNHTDKNSLPPANPDQPPLPINYLEKHPFPDGHPGLRDEVNVSGVWKRRDERTIRNEIGRQFCLRRKTLTSRLGKFSTSWRRWVNSIIPISFTRLTTEWRLGDMACKANKTFTSTLGEFLTSSKGLELKREFARKATFICWILSQHFAIWPESKRPRLKKEKHSNRF